MDIRVRVPNWLGDCVMSLPVFGEIRRAFPSAHVIAACREHLADCFHASPDINEVLTVPAASAGIADIYKSGKALRDRNINIGILLTNSFGTALWLRLGGVKKRIGFARDLRGLLLNCAFRPTPQILAAHQTEYYLYLLKGLGIDAGLSNPCLHATETGQEEAEGVLRNFGLARGEYATIAPFSAYGEVKDWPAQNYAQVARELAARTGKAVLILGTKGQYDRCAAIAGDNTLVLNASGLTGLAGFIALIGGSRLFVGGDSGGAHVAAALGVPTISIFGITEPSRTRALGDKVEVVGEGGMVTPDLKNPAIAAQARAALARITPEHILDRAAALL